MSQVLPTSAQQWNVVAFDGFDGLKLTEQPLPQLGDSQVLVKIQGASLNYRDLMIPKGQYPFSLKDNIVPGSDGAGTVLAVGKHVTRFKPGDKVVTIINQHHLGGTMTAQGAASGLGGAIDGTLRTVGAFDEQGLVAMPECLSFSEAATLSCAGVTAWNALFGLPGKQLGAGQWVLTQGTGGVSLFVVQIAKAIGARVISTTSSAAKAKVLKELGADHVVNYREVENWGEAAKKLTGGAGVDLVVDVAGLSTLRQSAASLRLDGTIAIVGVIGGEAPSGEAAPTLLDCWQNLYTARGVWVGSRTQMEDMCRAIEANPEKLRPIIDSKVFTLETVKEAYEYLDTGRNLGKVCIRIG